MFFTVYTVRFDSFTHYFSLVSTFSFWSAFPTFFILSFDLCKYFDANNTNEFRLIERTDQMDQTKNLKRLNQAKWYIVPMCMEKIKHKKNFIDERRKGCDRICCNSVEVKKIIADDIATAFYYIVVHSRIVYCFA